MPDGIEHREIGDRVGIGVGLTQVVAAFDRQVAHRLCLTLTVGVEQDLSCVATVFNRELRADGEVDAEARADRLDNFGTR